MSLCRWRTLSSKPTSVTLMVQFSRLVMPSSHISQRWRDEWESTSREQTGSSKSLTDLVGHQGDCRRNCSTSESISVLCETLQTMARPTPISPVPHGKFGTHWSGVRLRCLFIHRGYHSH